MAQFANVTLEKKANIYFDGKVTSRAVVLEDGSSITLGIMLPGDYTFNTAAKEIMDITEGNLSYRLVGGEWVTIAGNGKFEIPANSSFDLKVETVTDYCCYYITE